MVFLEQTKVPVFDKLLLFFSLLQVRHLKIEVQDGNVAYPDETLFVLKKLY